MFSDKRCLKAILERYKPKRIVIYSRDELKQYKMQQVFPGQHVSRLDVLRVNRDVRKGTPMGWELLG